MLPGEEEEVDVWTRGCARRRGPADVDAWPRRAGHMAAGEWRGRVRVSVARAGLVAGLWERASASQAWWIRSSSDRGGRVATGHASPGASLRCGAGLSLLPRAAASIMVVRAE